MCSLVRMCPHINKCSLINVLACSTLVPAIVGCKRAGTRPRESERESDVCVCVSARERVRAESHCGTKKETECVRLSACVRVRVCACIGACGSSISSSVLTCTSKDGESNGERATERERTT